MGVEDYPVVVVGHSVGVPVLLVVLRLWGEGERRERERVREHKLMNAE